mgnify:CR=1 FL=1
MGCLNDQINMVEREQTYIERCWFLLWFGGRLDVAAASFTLLSRFRKSSAPSSFSSCSVGLASESMLCVNFENLVSSSSGSSTCDDQNDGITR